MLNSELARLARRCLLFALPLALVGTWCELGLGSLDNSYTAKRRQLEAVAPTLGVVVAGPSGALSGIDPTRFGVPAYNLANGSQSLHYDTAILARYLDQMPRLRVVLIAQPYWYLRYELRNAPESWRQHFYSVFWNVPIEAPGEQLVTIQRISRIALYRPMTSLEYALKGWKVSLIDGLRENGWQPSQVPSAAQLAAGLDSTWTRLRVEGHRQSLRPESLARNLAAGAALAGRLRGKGATLVMVWFPVSAEYTAFFGQPHLAKERAAITELVQQAGVRFHDYGSDARFAPRDFYNADHLNIEGASKFSAILADEVVRPLLAR